MNQDLSRVTHVEFSIHDETHLMAQPFQWRANERTDLCAPFPVRCRPESYFDMPCFTAKRKFLTVQRLMDLRRGALDERHVCQAIDLLEAGGVCVSLDKSYPSHVANLVNRVLLKIVRILGEQYRLGG